MIEIAFDKHLDNFFNGQEYPLLEVPDLLNMPFEEYIKYAQMVLTQHADTLYLIVMADENRFSANKLALAMFVVSCFRPKIDVECLVLKASDAMEAFERYKPYIAVSVGIKYALHLLEEQGDNIYRELACLNYLNFKIKEDYVNNIIHYIPNNEVGKSIETHNLFDALLWVSIYKILALAEIKPPFELAVYKTKDMENIDAKTLVSAILKEISNYIDI